jgi:hypothetical protein
MRKIAYLDTNVLLHCKPIDELDWSSLLAANEIELVVTSIVTDELDLQKDQNPHLRLKRRARTVLKKLSAFWMNHQSAKILPHIYLRYDFVESRSLCEKYHLDPLSKDNNLIAAILDYKERHPSEDVVFITRDQSVLFKAKQFNIAPISPTKDMELEEEPDVVEKENERLKQELAKAQTRIPKIVFAFDNGSNHQRLEIEEELIITDDAIQKYLAEIREQYPKVIFQEKKPVISKGSFSLKDLDRVSKMWVLLEDEELIEIQGKKIPVTAEAVTEYNHQLEQFYEESSNYLIEGIQYQNRHRKIFPLKFALHNEGTSPGLSVKVTISIPPDLTVHDRFPLGKPKPQPQPPKPPARKTLYSPVLMPRLDMPYFDVASRIGPIVPDPSEPIIEAQKGHVEVTFVVPKLRHVDTPQDLGPVWITLPEKSKSFKLKYRINADNIPSKYEGYLHVVIHEIG